MADSSSQKKKTIRFLIVASIVGILLLVLCLKFKIIDLKAVHDKVAEVHDKVAQFNGGLVFLLMLLLPLAGVPVSFLFVIAGAKFGPLWGLTLAAVAVAFHLAASYWIGNSIMKKPLDWLFRKSGYNKPRIPEADAVPICAFISLVPGPPYALKNYGMVMGGVKFRPFFFTCLPTHFLSVTPGVLFGDFSGKMTTPRIIFLVVYFLVLIGLTRLVVSRLRKRKNLDSVLAKSAPDTV